MTGDPGAWRPIETAPEEQDILIYVAAWGPLIARRNAEFDAWTSRMQCPVSLSEEADRPTHWMPLPAPPDGHGAADITEHDRFATPLRAGEPLAGGSPAAVKTGH